MRRALTEQEVSRRADGRPNAPDPAGASPSTAQFLRSPPLRRQELSCRHSGERRDRLPPRRRQLNSCRAPCPGPEESYVPIINPLKRSEERRVGKKARARISSET